MTMTATTAGQRLDRMTAHLQKIHQWDFCMAQAAALYYIGTWTLDDLRDYCGHEQTQTIINRPVIWLGGVNYWR